jgi:hypothetical protein
MGGYLRKRAAHHCLPARGSPDALKAMAAGHVRGKLVITIR